MNSYVLHGLPTSATFDEDAYLRANQDVKEAVAAGHFSSGRAHFDAFGKDEKRRQIFSVDSVAEARQRKKLKIKSVLNQAMPMVDTATCFDFLTAELREQFSIRDTEAVSSLDYYENVTNIIEKHRDGLILDCGAGNRGTYYENVVNFEIVDYPSTDVRGVGEVLPFKDNSFDAVVSIAVLEHVKDPFRCAAEIIRVLKPGGDLVCAVPFLQPLHAYPNHFYNMSAQGIRNLFEPNISITEHEVFGPGWLLPWLLNSWANGLSQADKDEFLNLKVSDLMGDPLLLHERGFVKNLPREVNFELASATTIIGKKI